MCAILYDLLIGIPAGIVTGIVTGAIVTWYYRKKDNLRDKDIYVQNLKRHITSIYRLLRDIDMRQMSEESHEFVESLRDAITFSPIREERFLFAEAEKDICAEYDRLVEVINRELYEYSRCKEVLPKLLKMKNREGDYERTKKRQQEAIIKIAVQSVDWQKLRLKL